MTDETKTPSTVPQDEAGYTIVVRQSTPPAKRASEVLDGLRRQKIAEEIEKDFSITGRKPGLER